MNIVSYFFKDSKSYSKDSNLQSLVIDWLRFPLAVAVVFIHSFGSKELKLDSLHSNPLSLESIYDFLRITLSNIGTHFAVPVFFLFSGFLFFYKIKEFNFSIYKQKLRKRFHSLFIPYICWITIYVLHVEIRKVAGIIIKGKPISGIWEYIADNGGIHLFWDSSVWALNYKNWLGWENPMTGPILVPLWFLRDLMVVVLLTPIIYYLIKKCKLLPIIILAICYVSGVWLQIPGFTVTTFFWFSLGAFFSINHKNMIETIFRWRMFSYIVCLCTLLPLIWFNGRKGDGMTTNVIAQSLYPFFVIAASGSVISTAKVLVQKRIVRIYPHLARASFFIFLSHVFVLGYVSKILDKCLPFDNFPIMMVKYLAVPVIAVLVCLVIYRILDRIFPNILSLITGSRK